MWWWILDAVGCSFALLRRVCWPALEECYAASWWIFLDFPIPLSRSHSTKLSTRSEFSKAVSVKASEVFNPETASNRGHLTRRSTNTEAQAPFTDTLGKQLLLPSGHLFPSNELPSYILAKSNVARQYISKLLSLEYIKQVHSIGSGATILVKRKHKHIILARWHHLVTSGSLFRIGKACVGAKEPGQHVNCNHNSAVDPVQNR
jgi:hypothetical protein